MKYFTHPSTQKRLRFFIPRAVLLGLILFIYFIGWRPLRIVIAEQVVYPQLKLFSTAETHQMTLKAGSILFHYRYNDTSKKLQYRPGFGFFFLISLLGLLFVNAETNYYFLLIGLQLVTSLLAWLGLLLGVTGSSTGFILTDLLNAYLAPALSLAIVLFALSMDKRN